MSPPTNKKNRRKRPTRAQEGPSLAERLSALYSSMGVPAAMARQRMEDPAVDRLREYDLQRTARPRERRAKKSRDIAGAVYKHGRQVRIMDPTKTPGTVAKEILDLVTADLEAGGWKKIGWKAVKLHLIANWVRLRDSKPLPTAQLKLPERLYSRST